MEAQANGRYEALSVSFHPLRPAGWHASAFRRVVRPITIGPERTGRAGVEVPSRRRTPQGDNIVRSHSSPGRAEARLLLSLALAATLSALPQARAQDAKGAKPKEVPKVAKAAPAKVDLKEPVPFRVYQRDRDGRADIAGLHAAQRPPRRPT